jgi:GNAT superfamily N-acetyltransferase
MKTLRIQFGSDAAECLAVARSCLEADPLANNMVLSVLEAQADCRTATLRWAAVVDDTKTCVGVVAETWSSRPLLSSMTPEVAAFAMEQWLLHVGTPATVFGPAKTIAATKVTLASRPEWASPTAKTLLIYELTEVRMPPCPTEGLLVFPPNDLDVSSATMTQLLAWTFAFGIECDLPECRSKTYAADVDRATKARVAQGCLGLWVANGVPMAMAAAVRSSSVAATVGQVYTPPEHRGKGYASALVAHLSQHLLNQGAPRCLLFTDAGNPTSNKIYQRIGYDWRGEFLLLEVHGA